MRHGDTVARLGGDEFTLILPGIEKSVDAESIANKVLDALRPALKLGEHDLFVTASLGVAVYPDHGDSVEALLKNADAAMYRAKEDGRDTFRVFAREMGATVLDRLSVESELRTALVEGQLLAHYQPLVRAGTGEVLRGGGARALEPPHPRPPLPGRVPAPGRDERRHRPPGRLHALDGTAQLRDWHDQGLDHLSVCVNVSARQFQHSGLADDVAAAIKASRLPPRGSSWRSRRPTACRSPSRPCRPCAS